MLMAVVAVVVAFALVGVASAGAYVAGKVSGATTAKKSNTGTNPNNTASVALARAHSEATSIVRAANDASGSIVNSANKKARRQAAGIIAAAHRQAHSLVAAAQRQPTAVPRTGVGTAPVTAPTLGTASGTTVSPTAVPVYPAAGQTIVVPGAQRATPPDLRGVPAAWQVVGYNAAFGVGSGSAGTISVLNRSARTFSGTAVVKYTKGGTASASFSGLAPGQALVLPLNGRRYVGGGYRIVLQGLR